MSTGDNNRWRRIQVGVKDTERLIGQKDYNGAMMKSRQTLEFMEKLLAERDNIPNNGDLKSTIDALYQNRRISRTTCEHYHKIRIIGNKAAHEGNKSAHSANQAYRLLSQEMYGFTDAYQSGGRPSTRQNVRRAPARNRNYGRKRPGKKKRPVFTVFDLWKLLIPALCIVLLFLVIRVIKPDSDDKESLARETSTELLPTSSDMVATPTTPPATTDGNGGETEPMPTTAGEPAGTVYKASTELNVRPQPNTNEGRIGMLDRGTVVEYVRKHDEEWAVIMYNGKEAYVASEYLIRE